MTSKLGFYYLLLQVTKKNWKKLTKCVVSSFMGILGFVL